LLRPSGEAFEVVDEDTGEPEIDAWTLVGLGGFLVGCVVMGLVLGWLADNQWDSQPVGILLGLGIGIVAGVVGSCVRIAQYLRH
jgi:F0F1-type ATP synthase assembly protein I